MVRIFCKNTGTYKEFLEGTPLLDIAPQFEFDKPCQVSDMVALLHKSHVGFMS